MFVSLRGSFLGKKSKLFDFVLDSSDFWIALVVDGLIWGLNGILIEGAMNLESLELLFYLSFFWGFSGLVDGGIWCFFSD